MAGACGWTASRGRGSTFGFSVPGGAQPADDRTTGAGHGRPTRRRLVACRGRPAVAGPAHAAPGRGRLRRRDRARRRTDGVGLVRGCSPDAVVLDIRLPGMDGWEVLARLKADPATDADAVVVGRVVDERSTGLALGGARLPRQAGQPRRAVDGPRRVRRAARRGDRRSAAMTRRRGSSSSRTTSATSSWSGTCSARRVRGGGGQTGEQGVALARRSGPDLVLMDLQLPGIDGAEALRRLRARARDRGTSPSWRSPHSR